MPWLSGDTTASAQFGSNNASNNQIAIFAESRTNTGIYSSSVSGIGVHAVSATGRGLNAEATGSGLGAHISSVSGTGAVIRSASNISALIQSDSTTNTSPTLVVQRTGTATGDLFQAQDDVGTSLVKITSTGNVGIGTTTPTAILHVVGGRPIFSHDSGNHNLQLSAPGTNGGDWSMGVSDDTNGIGGGKKFFLTPDINDSIASVFTVLPTGRIGMGSNSPTTGTRLDIVGTTSADSSIIIPRATVANRPTTGVNGMIRYASDTNKFEAYENGAWINMIGGGAASSVAASAGTAASPSMSFSGDTNTGFYSNGADTIGVSTNGTNVFNISTTSISSPTTGGALMTSGNGTAAAPTFSFAGDPDTGWFRPAANTMAASTAGTERMRIDSSGNVGIGATASANRRLEVVGSTVNDSIVKIRNSNATGVSGIQFNDDGDNWQDFIGHANSSHPAYANKFVISTNTSDVSFIMGDTGGVAGTEKMTIKNSGNVGIGTTTPSSLFDISSSAGGVFTLSRNSGAILQGDTIGKIQFWNNDVSLTTQKIYGSIEMEAAQNISSDAARGSIIFKTTGASAGDLPTERMRIDASGISIGTINATPVYPLQVSSRGTAGADSYFLTLTDTRPAAQANISAGDGVSLRFSTVSDTIGLATIHALATTNGASNADLVFQTNNGTNRTEKMRITAGGNVGIGTTSPGTKLQINGPWVNGEGQLHIVADTGSDAMVSTTADSGKESGLLLAHDSGGVDKEWWVYSSNYFGSDDFKIAETTTGPSWPVRLTIKKGGNVGIGNTAPAKLLHVGSASVASATAVANFQNADGTCTITPAASGSGIACSSDERLKENFRDVSGEFALDRILQLQAVTYNFKTSSDANRRTGYKAQEVQKIAPEFVRENEDGFLQVYYDAFIPWITEAIKTLYSRIVGIEDNQAVQARQIASKADKTETEALKAENAQLKQENAEIKARLERIEKALNSK